MVVMNKINVLLCLIVCWMFPILAYAKPKLTETPTVAVMDFGTHPGAATSDISIANAGKTTSEYVTDSLVKSGRFIVMERDLHQKSLEEERLKTTGLIDPDTAKRIGELLHVDYLIYGNVTDISVSDTGTQVNTFVVGGVTVGTVKAHIIVRMMEIKTGSIIMAAKGEGNSKSSYVKVGTRPMGLVSIGTKTVTQDSVHNALQKGANAAVELLAERLYGKPQDKIEG